MAPKEGTMNELNIEILKKYSIEELIVFHRVLGDNINEMIKEKARNTMVNFSFGEEVYFINKCGHRIEGKVERFNQKSISINTWDGVLWRVHPSLVKKILKN
jgi:small-conductance mechanosensitive channel